MGRWLLGLSSTLMRMRFLKKEDLEKVTQFLHWLFNKKHHPISSDEILYKDSEDVFQNYKRISAALYLMKKEDKVKELNNVYRNGGVFNSHEQGVEDQYILYFKRNMLRLKHKVKLLFTNDNHTCICRNCSVPLIPYGTP
jgi:hypothetical protein